MMFNVCFLFTESMRFYAHLGLIYFKYQGRVLPTASIETSNRAKNNLKTKRSQINDFNRILIDFE